MSRSWSSLALYALSLATGVAFSHSTGPTFDELARIAAVERASDLVRGVATSGVHELSSASARAIFAALDPERPLVVLLAAWSRLSIGRIGLLDPLTSERLPWLLLAAGVPAWVATAVRPSLGARTAWLAGALLLVTPRWLHALASAGEGAVVAGLWWLVLVPYLRVLEARRSRVAPALMAALALGIAVAISSAALWVVPVIALHFCLAQKRIARRLVARGRLPMPPAIIAGLAIAAPLVLATNPQLWGADAITMLRWVLRPLAPVVVPTLYAGRVVSAPPVPAGYATAWLVSTLPAVLLVCATIGVIALAHRGLARRFASGNLRPPRDRQALGALVVLGLVLSLIAPGLEPDVLLAFPPRVELALPFVAIAGAVGLERAARMAAGGRGWLPVAGVVLLAVTWLAVRAPGTASASFDVLLGGARRVVRARALPTGDGSEIASLAPRIDALGQSRLALDAPDVPARMWEALHNLGRLRTAVTRGHDFELRRGPVHGAKVLATVERDGAVLWSLTRR